MPRKIETLPRLLLTLFVVAAAIGCESDKVKGTPDQRVGPVSPIFLFLDVRASRTTITAGETANPITINVQANFADTGQPVADGTIVNLSATLGGFDAAGGPATLALEMFDGKGSTKFFPGDVAGTSRIKGEMQGLVDQLLITIKDAGPPPPPPEPAPTASTISASADITTVSEEDAETQILVEATVFGSDAEPFSNGPVQFSSPIGVFDSSGSSSSEVLATNGNGQVIDLLTVTGTELTAVSGSTFTITATLFLEGGGTKTATITINIVDADDPPTPTSIVLSAAPTTVNDDGGADEVVTLTAVVRDQNGALMEGVDVTFNPELGSAAPVTDATDSSGEATSTLTVPAASITAFPNDTFEVEAVMGVIGGTQSDTLTITIVRPAASVTAEFTADDFSPCNASIDGSVVQFTDTSTGPVVDWDWDLDGDGFFGDSNVPNPTFDYDGFADGVGVNVTLRVTNGGVLIDTVTHVVTPGLCT